MLQEDLESQRLTEDIQAFKGYNPRLGFVRKVYGLLSFQLLFTTVFVYLSRTTFKSFFNPQYLDHNPWAVSLLWLSVIGEIIIMCMITCCSDLFKQVPLNYFLLTIFTLCESFTVAYTTMIYEAHNVLLAAVLTVSLTLILTFYALVTKHDFSIYTGMAWILAWAITSITIISLAIPSETYHGYHTFHLIVAVFAICIYGFYLLVDTELIMGGGMFSLSLDDYVIADIVIYIDMIVLFLRILAVLSALSRR